MFTSPSTLGIASKTRSAGTLGRILAATRKILARDGYASLSMRAVAAEAGVSPGAIYKHFSSKDHLVSYVCHSSLEEFDATLVRAIARFAPGSFDRVIAQGAEYIRFAFEKPEQFKILFSPNKARPEKLKELPGGAGFQILRQSLADAMEAGAIRQGDPDLAAFFLWSRVHGIVTLLMACDFSETLPLPKKELTPQRLFELSREFLWEGFRPADKKQPGDGERP